MTIKEFKIQYALGTLDRDYLYELACSKSTSKEVLKILSKDEDSNVRYGVARNPNIPIEILKILSKDITDYVRHGVAGNPNTPIKIKKVLKNDLRRIQNSTCFGNYSLFN